MQSLKILHARVHSVIVRDHSILVIKSISGYYYYSNVTSTQNFNFTKEKGNYHGLVQSLSIDWDLFFADFIN